MNVNELAKELSVRTNWLPQIILGKRGMSGNTALRLGRWFGTGPDIWINLQKIYGLRLAAIEIDDAPKKFLSITGRGRRTASYTRNLVTGAERAKSRPDPLTGSCFEFVIT
jgi:addiction module HigA family antidote